MSGDIDRVTRETDILITTTPSSRPLVKHVSQGTHINAIGADAKGKQEIHSDLLKESRLVIDDWDQASHSGEINVPLQRGIISRNDIHGTLGEIVAGKKKGRLGPKEITLFDSTGLAIQDVACASVIYRTLKEKSGIRSITLF